MLNQPFYNLVELAKQYKAEIKSAIETLLNTLQANPDIWNIRKEAARLLFDNSRYKEAAEIVWAAPEIPAVDLEIAFAARVLSRAYPNRAIRLLNHVLEKTVESPAKLLAIANALMHYGMVMQATRFYGAATASDSSLVNADLEHFMLWLDDSHRLWGDWEKDDQQMDELPWVKRDESKGEDFKKMMKGLTTPIKVPGLNESTAEHLVNEYYRQVPIRDAEITAPPAVTVPLDQLNPDDVIHNEKLGASITRPKGAIKKPQSIARPEMTPVKMALPETPQPSTESAPIKKPAIVKKPAQAAGLPTATEQPVLPKPAGYGKDNQEHHPVGYVKPNDISKGEKVKGQETGEQPKDAPKLLFSETEDEPKKPKFLF